MDKTNSPTKVDFHFDVMCPWAYQTSLWMREVSNRRDIEVNWRFFSLEEVNLTEGKKTPVGKRLVLRVVNDAYRGALEASRSRT